METNALRVKLENDYYTIACFSVIGNYKIENQDSFSVFNDENQIIIIVADGLGSAIYSREGSKKIAYVAKNILRNTNDYSKLALQILSDWKKDLSGNLDLYDTTLKFIKITKDSVIYGGVGDGWIAINTNDGFISLEAHNTFSNQTDTILSYGINEKFIIKSIDIKDFDIALISTDGFSEDIDKESGKEFLDAISNQMSADINLFTSDIQDTLINWPIETNKDDKTVIFIKKEH